MTDENTVGDREPRLFLRRGFAFLLDALVAQLIAGLLFAAINATTGISLGDSLKTYQTQCSPAPAGHPQIARIDVLWPLPSGARRENLICSHSGDGNQSQTFFTRVVSMDGATTYTSEVSYPLDKDGKALPIEYELDLTYFAVILFFIVLSANGRRTPGKAMTSLRIKTAEGGVPSWGHAIRRETFKLLPLVLFGALTLWMAFAPPAMMSDSEVSITAMRDGIFLTSPWMMILLGWSAFTILWWFGPFVVWRGRTWYDALAGTKLLRSDLTQASARRPR